MKQNRQHFKIILLVLTLFFICTNQNAIVHAAQITTEQPSDNEDNGNSTEENQPENPDIPVLDKTALKEQLTAAEAILPNQNRYTTSTYNALVTALNTAKQIYADENSSQQEIDTACTNLKMPSMH